MEITCVRIEAYEHQDRILLNTQQVIPVTEAEEYMTKRREKQEKQESSRERQWTLPLLLDRGILVSGDIVVFAESRVPDDADREWNPEDDFWRGRVPTPWSGFTTTNSTRSQGRQKRCSTNSRGETATIHSADTTTGRIPSSTTNSSTSFANVESLRPRERSRRGDDRWSPIRHPHPGSPLDRRILGGRCWKQGELWRVYSAPEHGYIYPCSPAERAAGAIRGRGS